MSSSAPCLWMRGGTSKGGYFLADDLPLDVARRDQFLLSVMGSPDPRQIDGMGGADPLTSKVAVIRKSERAGIDVDYLFLQVFVDQDVVSDAQNCGNILAGVGPFAIEKGLVTSQTGQTSVTIYMENTGQTAVALVQTPDGAPVYEGDAQIDGVPGTAAPVSISFQDTAGSTCGALLPTGNALDVIDGVEVTCIDNGMPVVVLRAADLQITGQETREELDQNTALKEKLESIRLQAGVMMNLGDVRDQSVPKMSLVSSPQKGGAVNTRTFIPRRCHASIGVLGALSVATACMLPNTPGASVATIPAGSQKTFVVEHPIGAMSIVVDVDEAGSVMNAAILRTARKLFDGVVFAI